MCLSTKGFMTSMPHHLWTLPYWGPSFQTLCGKMNANIPVVMAIHILVKYRQDRGQVMNPIRFSGLTTVKLPKVLCCVLGCFYIVSQDECWSSYLEEIDMALSIFRLCRQQSIPLCYLIHQITCKGILVTSLDHCASWSVPCGNLGDAMTVDVWVAKRLFYGSGSQPS